MYGTLTPNLEYEALLSGTKLYLDPKSMQSNGLKPLNKQPRRPLFCVYSEGPGRTRVPKYSPVGRSEYDFQVGESEIYLSNRGQVPVWH